MFAFLHTLHRSLGASATARRLALISFFGQLYFFVPFMTPYLLQRQLTIAEIAGLQTTLMVAMLVMEIPTGVLADRLGHVWSVRLSLIVLALGEILFLFARDYPTFLAIQIITGSGFALSSGSVDALIYDSLPEGDRVTAMQRARGLLGAATQSGSVVAYSFGGVIAADLSLHRMTITIVMGGLAVSTAAVLTFGLREAPGHATRVRPASRAVMASALVAIRCSPELHRLILLAVVTTAFGAHLLVFYQQYFLETGVPGVWFGLALSVASIGVVLGQLWAWRITAALGTRRGLLLATGVPGLLYFAMAVGQRPELAVTLFIVQWAAIHVSGPLLAGLYHAHLPDDARATGISLINAGVTVYIGAGGIVLGWLAGRSLPLMFALVGVVIVAGALLVRINDRPDETSTKLPSSQWRPDTPMPAPRGAGIGAQEEEKNQV